MFNLFVSAGKESWDSSPVEIERERAVVEYTADEISERYKEFDEKAISELKSFPCLFVVENEEIESRIGYITNIRVRKSTIVLHFEFDPVFPALRIGAIEDLRIDIELGKFELSRTHWAVKDEPLFEILLRNGYISLKQLDATSANKEASELREQASLKRRGDNFKTSLPTKQQLRELTIDNLRIFTTRCALRVLPFTVGVGVYEHLNQKRHKSHLVEGLHLAACGFYYAGAAAYTVYNTGEAAIYSNNPAAPASFAAYTAANVNDAFSAVSVADAAAVFLKEIAKEISQDYYLLLDNSSIETLPLWKYNIPVNFSKQSERWYKAANKLGLSEYTNNYKKILKGGHNPKSLYESLYKKWIIEDERIKSIGGEYTDLIDRPDDVGSIEKGSSTEPEVTESDKKNNNTKNTKEIGNQSNSELPSNEDHLGRERLVEALGDVLSHTEHDKPLTIGLLGDWGAGKTTVLNLLVEKLKKQTDVNYRTQMFNAWSYEHTENIQAGVAQEAIIGLSSQVKGWRNKVKLSWNMHRNLGALKTYGQAAIVLVCFLAIIFLAINGRAETIWGIGIGTTLTILFLYKQLSALFTHNISHGFFKSLQLPDYNSKLGQLPLYQAQIDALAKLCLGKNDRLLFMVDDLDRCSPEGIVKVFEAIRLVMELDRVTVIIAIDHRIALSALAHHYKELEDVSREDTKDKTVHCRNKYDIARDYLGKIIQMPINLDTPDNEMIQLYVDHLFDGDLNEVADTHADSDEVLETDHQQSSAVADEHESKQDIEPNQEVLNEIEKLKGIERISSFNDNLDYEVEEAPPIENVTMKHSDEEKQSFGELTQLLRLHNPRQLKRLHSSYRLLRAYTNEAETVNLTYMSALFWLEFINSKDFTSCHKKVAELNACFGIEDSEDEVVNKMAEVFTDEKTYNRLKAIVEPYVLPQSQSGA